MLLGKDINTIRAGEAVGVDPLRIDEIPAWENGVENCKRERRRIFRPVLGDKRDGDFVVACRERFRNVGGPVKRAE